MTEMKDNSIDVYGYIVNTAEKQSKDGQFVEIKFQVDAKLLDGKRDALAACLADMVFIKLTPRQTELNTDDGKQSPRDVTPASGQIDFIDGGEA
ncbi:hypothetical protein [Lacticaseibacillus jixiensis]|uniref:hypothetical protein n=1 Tax=Lacticaseibacillus jixiensis TaxID=3231926 RepID=UPI0036F2A626